MGHKPLPNGLASRSTPGGGCGNGGAVVDSAGEEKKPEARKMLENVAESPPSTAPTMMASYHFIRKDEDLRPENALFARFVILIRLRADG
jgi:hypothetical protein